MSERRWSDDEGEAVYRDGRLSITAKPSLGPREDGMVIVGIEAPWIAELEGELKRRHDALVEIVEANDLDPLRAQRIAYYAIEDLDA